MEAEIGQLRAQLLHKDQENERVQLQLQEEKEERERAQRKARPCSASDVMTMHPGNVKRNRLRCAVIVFHVVQTAPARRLHT